MDPVMSDLERLVALEDIRALKARRDRAIDAKDWETFEATHWPEHISDIEDTGTKTIKETVVDIGRMLEHMDTTHHSHTPDSRSLRPPRQLAFG